MLINILLILVIILQIILLSCFVKNYPSEKFSPGWGVSFGEFVQPIPPCRDENDCSRGHPQDGHTMKICANQLHLILPTDF